MPPGANLSQAEKQRNYEHHLEASRLARNIAQQTGWTGVEIAELIGVSTANFGNHIRMHTDRPEGEMSTRVWHWNLPESIREPLVALADSLNGKEKEEAIACAKKLMERFGPVDRVEARANGQGPEAQPEPAPEPEPEPEPERKIPFGYRTRHQVGPGYLKGLATETGYSFGQIAAMIGVSQALFTAYVAGLVEPKDDMLEKAEELGRHITEFDAFPEWALEALESGYPKYESPEEAHQTVVELIRERDRLKQQCDQTEAARSYIHRSLKAQSEVNTELKEQIELLNVEISRYEHNHRVLLEEVTALRQENARLVRDLEIANRGGQLVEMQPTHDPPVWWVAPLLGGLGGLVALALFKLVSYWG